MKTELRSLLTGARFDAVVELATQRRQVLSALTSLTYDGEPLVAWRAVEALGLAAGPIADRDPEFLRTHLRRLFWLLTDESGSIGWRAPEAIGEIIRSRPDLFRSFVPLLLSLLDMEEEDLPRFQAGTLWAVGRVAQSLPADVEPAVPAVLARLADPDPQTRGMAVWCLDQLGSSDHLGDVQPLAADSGPVDLYQAGDLARTSVGELVRVYCRRRGL
jgi:hypothetical protein